MNAQSPAAEMSPAASLAQLAPGGKNRKSAAKKGPAIALEAAPRKGKGSFFSLVSALAATKGARPAGLETGTLLKSLASKGAAAKAALPAGGDLPAAEPTPAAESARETASRDEKTGAKKRPTTVQGLPQIAAQLVSIVTIDTSKKAAPHEKQQPGESAADSKSVAAARSSSIQKPEPAIRIVDLRAKRSLAGEEAGAAKITAQSASAEKDLASVFTQKPASVRDGGPAPDKPSPTLPLQTQSPLERLREMAGSELLKATNVVLKDGGGEIRLVLKPESLGSVRIRMNVVDNTIEGRIIVDNASVKHVIDGSIDALRRALTAEGFQTASLSVSVGGQKADTGERDAERPPESVRRITAQGFDRNVPGLESLSMGDLLVNLFV